MTVKDIESRIEQIKACGRDYEAAHAAEDRLYVELLGAIAEGKCRNPKACAKAALATQKMDFPRYCA